MSGKANEWASGQTNPGYIQDPVEHDESSSSVDGIVESDIVPPVTATKKDVALMIFINFLSFVCFAIVLPSLWPFLESFGARQSLVGWAVAANSFGTFVASPILGIWADRRGVREVIFFSLVLMIAGNLLYSLSPNRWILLLARFVVGCAAANYAPASAYLAYATHPSNRTFVMTLNSAASILGFILGPSLATALTFFEFTVWKFKWDSYTNPGYTSVIMSLIGIAFLPTFRDIPAPKNPDLNPQNQSSRKSFHGEVVESTDVNGVTTTNHGSQIIKDSMKKISRSHVSGPLTSANSTGSIRALGVLMKPDTGLPKGTIAVCLFLQFSFYNAFTVFETIGTPYTFNAFGWGVFDNGLLFAGIGGLCIVALAILQFFVACFRDRTLLVVTEILMIAGFGILISYPFHSYTDLPRFLVGVGIASSAFSAACALLISIFSKVLGHVEQGLLMGWLSAAGSIARTIGPVVSGYLLEYLGGGLVFAVVAGMLIASLLVTVVYYPKIKTVGKWEEEQKLTKKKKNPKRKKERTPSKGIVKERTGGKKVHASLSPAFLGGQSLVGSEEHQREPGYGSLNV